MRAAQINEYGHADAVKLVEIDTPVPSKGQVQVEVYAASINPFDTSVREGRMKEMIPLKLPVTLGGDIAGIVSAVGDGVTSVSVGDKVYGQANVASGNSGAFADFAVTVEGQLAPMPKNVDFGQAASLALVGASTVQAITEHLNLQSGQKIFIHGGAGGIGSVAIQIAKHLGAYVATTATGDGVDYVKKLGADEVVDYKTEDFVEKLRDFDAVFDLTRGDEFDKTLNVLKKGGVAVSMITTADPAKAAELGVTAIAQSTQITTDRLNKLTKLVEAGVVLPKIERYFPLEQIQQAFVARETGAIRGKVVVSIK